MTKCTDAITVNVGGTRYQTTLATLTRVEGSMLGALSESFEGDAHELFLDRDGPSFRYILNYLRDPFATPLLPRDRTERDQLRREADFYGLPVFVASRGPFAGPFVASRGNKVATLDPLQHYELTFAMELARDWRITKGTYQSILHIGDSNHQRFPGIWFHKSSNALHVKITTGDGGWGWGVGSTTGVAFAAGGTYEVKVLVANNILTVYVDGVSVGTGSGSTTDVATDAAVYVGDPWHPAAKVTLSNIVMREIA